MRTLLTFTILLCIFNLKAQSWNSKIFGNKNYFEFGNTYAHYPNAGFGYTDISKRYVNYRKHNYFLGYTRIIKDKYILAIDFTSGFTPNNNYDSKSKVGEIISSNFKMCNLGLGKLFNFSRIQINPKIALSYRFSGMQWTTFGYRNPGSGLSEPLFAYLMYNSIGFSMGLDANYFFTKNLGIGIKATYNLYPFENAKLSSGNTIDQPDRLLIETHKPLNQVVILNFKIIGRL
jgi:hypothetical protein